MAPLKSSLARSASKLFGVFRERDTSLRGYIQSSRLPPPFEASGGTTYEPGNGYKYHVFTYPNSDNFQVTSGSDNIEVLIVAGGGGGGSGYYPGTGGAGGVLYGTNIAVNAPNTYPITVGDGGVGATKTGNGTVTGTGTNGQNSSFNSVTALGGGGGGAGPAMDPVSIVGDDRSRIQSGNPGGSGGGASYYAPPPGEPYGRNANASANADPQPAPGDYTPYGNPGGANRVGGTVGAGGGGAGGAGSGQQGGAGQPFSGFEYPLIGLSPLDPYSPTNNHYGGGGSYSGTRSDGGGGANTAPLRNGVDKLGGGGGAGANPGTGGTGGEGIVVVRYLLPT